MPFGVGVIGAGPGVDALHLPTLARLEDDFRVVHIADAGSGRAGELAARTGARTSSGIDRVLADELVDVVAVCSPPEHHTAHVLAAVAAGKRAVMCEKPLALAEEDAAAAVDACRAAGAALIVGTHHLHDAAWGRAKHHLLAGAARVRAISATLALPPNARYHDVVTERTASPTGRGGPPLHLPDAAASVVRQLILGLGVHDLPMLRDLAPDLEAVEFAVPIAPIGYAVGYRASGIPVQLSAVMLPGGADALWRIEIATDADLIEVRFPPSFVHAGSAAVQVCSPDGRVTAYAGTAEDGYIALWRSAAAMLRGELACEYGEVLADADFAVRLADAAAAAVRSGLAAGDAA